MAVHAPCKVEVGLRIRGPELETRERVRQDQHCQFHVDEKESGITIKMDVGVSRAATRSK